MGAAGHKEGKPDARTVDLSPRLNLELSAGLGVARIAYHTEPVNGPKPSTNLNRVRYLPMPTELGISLVYLFNAKK